MNLQLSFLQKYLKLLASISPKLASKKALQLFQTIRKKGIRDREKSFFATAFHINVPFYKGNIDVYTKGNPNGDIIFVVHGWDSNAGSLAMIADELVELGYKIVALNLPGHAFDESNKSNYFECKEAVKAMVKFLNPQNPVSFITHSFGSGITAGALAELDIKVDKLFFITTPFRLIDFFKQFKQMLKVGDKTYKYMIDWANDLLGEDLNNIRVDNKLQQFNFKHLFLIHDQNDKVLPYSNSMRVHNTITNSTLIPIEKAGHYRILWKKEVLDIIMNEMAVEEKYS